MKKHIDMLSGDIMKVLLALALPIIASNFVQTAFGLVDMIWIGRLGTNAVSAIGTANFYISIATGVATIVVIGTGVRIAQSLGADDHKTAQVYTKNGLTMALVLSVLFTSVIFIFAHPLIDFFKMGHPEVEVMAVKYLRHALIGIPFLFLSTVGTTVLTSYGNTKLTFKANTAGLLLNIALDPIMIFGFAGIPAMGVIGAAWATTISRGVTLAILFIYSNDEIKASLSQKLNLNKIKEVMKISWPATAQTLIFTAISMVIAKLVIVYGTDAIATQKIGIQIESITWVTIGGLQGAISAFVGQNYGGNKPERIVKGYNSSLKIVTVFGLIVTSIFLLLPKQIFSIFISDPKVIDMGVGYMVAIAFSQVFMCFEMLSVGAFNGLGKTYAPPLVSIFFTGLRIPLSMLLMPYLGLSGIWWSISITSMFKGVVMVVWYKIILKDLSKNMISI
ncbi:MAG: MATE family efflux transporter [Erysipelothrix sp.]|nr:MATE family efflux transporter [Erysipelothrix sp.]